MQNKQFNLLEDCELNTADCQLKTENSPLVAESW